MINFYQAYGVTKNLRTPGAKYKVEVAGVTYIINCEQISVGDQVYSPLNGRIVEIDEVDNLKLVNKNCYKIEAKAETKVRPKFFKY
jgi:glycine cleavage system H lipoate-binding protein